MAAAGPAVLTIEMVMQGLGAIATGLNQGAQLMDRFRASTDRANTAITELRAAQGALGGTAAGVGGLAAAFGTLGLGTGAAAGAAEGLRERLFSDPLAIGTFGRAVVPARMGGPQDSAAILMEAIGLLRETTNLEERRLRALRLGITELLPLADLDERRFNLMVQEGQIRGAMVNRELRELRAVSDAAGERIRLLREERDLVRERIGLTIGNWFRENVQLPIEETFNRTLGIGNRRGAAGARGMSRDRIMEENTLALRLMQQELANSGPRGRGALPPQLRGEALNQAIQSLDLRWGAFSLS